MPSPTNNFLMLMEELKKNHEDVQKRLDKLEGDVASGQDNAARIVVEELKADRSYTFRKEGHKEQYQFNAGVESRFTKAQVEAAKIQPTAEKEQKSLEALNNQRKEGIQAIACCQKRIKVADRSEVVKAYDSDKLASDSEDEKCLAEKTAEREMLKKKRSSKDNQFAYQQTAYQAVGGVQHGRLAVPTSSGGFSGDQSSGSGNQAVSQWNQSTVRKIGSCFRCAAWGHLQKNCPKVAKYPFMWIDKGSNIDKANSGIASPSSNELGWETPQQGSAAQTTLCSVECFNPWEEECLSHGDPTVGRYWETDGDILKDKSKQIYDVQGRLKSSFQFWVEVLQAKPPVINWILGYL